MSELNITKSESVDVGRRQFSVNSNPLEFSNTGEDTIVNFTEAAKYWGYYKQIPELKKAVDALAMWVIGKGYNVFTDRDEVILDSLRGWGEDSFQSIVRNMLVTKKIQGDSFAEIIRDKETGTLINLKPISPERVRIIVGSNGLIKRYEVKSKSGEWKPLAQESMLHLCNDRVGDEIRGNSVIEACKWVIDARNEAMQDFRKVLHRNVIPVRIVEVDTDDTTKIAGFKTQYIKAAKDCEVLIIPRGTISMTADTIKIENPMVWIQYLENFFYQAVGIPKIILGGSEQFTEASSKVGYLTFEQVYMAEQSELEDDLKHQLGIEIKFNRPVSLKDEMQGSEEKNTGQVGFQPKESGINMQRE
jgi:hypothetical protein